MSSGGTISRSELEDDNLNLRVANERLEAEVARMKREREVAEGTIRRMSSDSMILSQGLRKAEDFLREVAWLAEVDDPNPDPDEVIDTLTAKFGDIKIGLEAIERNTLEIQERMKEKDLKLKWYEEVLRDKLEGGVRC